MIPGQRPRASAGLLPDHLRHSAGSEGMADSGGDALRALRGAPNMRIYHYKKGKWREEDEDE